MTKPKIVKIEKYPEQLQIIFTIKNSRLELFNIEDTDNGWAIILDTSEVGESITLRIAKKNIDKILGEDLLTRYHIVFDFLERDGETYFYTLNFVIAHPEIKPILIDKKLLKII
jgi:hypothetical protein